ncbi:MAG TPA: nucleotide exchange factor GrpE [Firmicutes bacterium]|nr:nucleotide exchange factor GrpE [Bacillota bacterium]
MEEMHKPESAETVHEAVEEHVEDCEVEERAEQAGEQAPAETELKEQCEQLERLNAELANQLLRLRADFENYRRRTRSQIEEIKAQASADLMMDLLPILDDFERAVQSAEQTDQVEALAQGITMVFSKMLHVLGSHGLARIEATGEPFDANLHEAVSVIGDTDGPLHVLQELQTGYTLNGKVIRHTKVQVGELKGD